MTLREWLDRERKTTQEFAAAIGRTSEAVRRYIAGDRIPDKETMPLIFDVTGGAVTPNDFFGITDGAVMVHPKIDTDSVAMCGRCGERAEASQVTSCTSVHCPMRAQEAA